MGHLIFETFYLIFEIIMGFVSFGSVAVLFASVIGLAIWGLRRLWDSE